MRKISKGRLSSGVPLKERLSSTTSAGPSCLRWKTVSSMFIQGKKL
jgi:hypothetical protein